MISYPRQVGLIMRVGTFGHPCRVKSFRKAMSAVMDDLELYDSIIDNLHLLSLCLLYVNNLRTKLAQL